MAVASSDMPIKQLMGSTYSAGFDLTARTPIDGRLGVKTLADLTDEKAWRSRSQKDDQHPEYWLFNGLFTSVAETGKIYVLVGIDESKPATFWPSPAGPGEITTGPHWVELGGVDNFLQEASIVVAKYGYIPDAEDPGYYEEGDPNFDHVYEDVACTIEASASKYLKLVVKESNGTSGSIRKILYCDVSNLVGNVKMLTILANGQLVMEFDGNQSETLNFTGVDNVNIGTVAPNSGAVNVNLVWLGLEPAPYDIFHVVFMDWDGSIISEQDVPEGDMPVIPSDPVREGYEFIGWEPTVSPATGDTTYTATYQNTPPLGVIRYFYGHESEGDRDPDNNSFVSVDQSPSDKTSSTYYIMPHTVIVDSSKQFQVVAMKDQYGYGYAFPNNNSVVVHLVNPTPTPRTWELWFTVQSGSSNVRNIEVRDPDGNVIGVYPATVKGSEPLQIHLSSLESGDYTFTNEGGGTAIVGMIIAKEE